MPTYRDYIERCDIGKVIDMLILKHKEDNPEKDFEYIREVYQGVIDQLRSLPVSKPIHPIELGWIEEWGGYFDVAFLNESYVQPPEGTTWKDWGDNPMYQKYSGFGLSPWTSFIDSEIIITESASLHVSTIEQVLAELIWETTFYGFSSEETAELASEINETIESLHNPDGSLKTEDLMELNDEGEWIPYSP